EFPKKNVPYSETMGRRARTWAVRGYCITYPTSTGISLYDRDYRKARDELVAALEDYQDPATLQLPTMQPMLVLCPQYRLTEEERAGGYCVFDMHFVEYGMSPSQPQANTSDALKQAALDTKQRILKVMPGQEQKIEMDAKSAPRLIPPPQPP